MPDRRAPASDGTPASLQPLAGERLLAAWEDGSRCHELYRSLAVLAAAQPETDPAALAALPVAQRDLRLLRVRQLTFGTELAAFGRCTACAEPLEFTLQADEIAAGLAGAAAAVADRAEWTQDGRRYRLRLVTTVDLAAALALTDPGAAADLLLARCLEIDDARFPAAGSEPGPDDVAGAVPAVPAEAARRFAELHADAEIRCAVDCPACGVHQLLDLDIGPFLWREVSAAARRLLTEVHLLAIAYRWSERDILALSPARRAAYLELAGAG